MVVGGHWDVRRCYRRADSVGPVSRLLSVAGRKCLQSPAASIRSGMDGLESAAGGSSLIREAC